MLLRRIRLSACLVSPVAQRCYSSGDVSTSQWFCGSCLARNSSSISHCESCGARSTVGDVSDRRSRTAKGSAGTLPAKRAPFTQKSALEALLQEEEGADSRRYSQSSIFGEEDDSRVSNMPKSAGLDRPPSLTQCEDQPLLTQLDRSSPRRTDRIERASSNAADRHRGPNAHEGHDKKATDWKCPVCFYPNFGSRTDCRKCKADKPPEGLFDTRVRRKSEPRPRSNEFQHPKSKATIGVESKSSYPTSRPVGAPPPPPTSRLVPLHPLYRSFSTVPYQTAVGSLRERAIATLEGYVGGAPLASSSVVSNSEEYKQSMQLGDWGCGKCGSLNKRIRDQCFNCRANKFSSTKELDKDDPSQPPSAPVPYVSITGWQYQLALAKAQSQYAPLYAEACLPQVVLSESVRVREGVDPVTWKKNQFHHDGEKIDESAVGQQLKDLTYYQRHAFLFTEPSWFCRHCGLLSPPSERLPKAWRQKIQEGSMSPYESRVYNKVTKFRPTCEHCLTVRGSREGDDMNACTLPSVSPLRKGNIAFRAPKDTNSGKFLIKGKNKPSTLAGDWSCKCGNLNYRLRRVCAKCGGGRVASMMPYELHQPAKYGDWVCSCCLLWNFRQNTECYNCCYEGSQTRSKHTGPKWSDEDSVRLGIRHDLPVTKEEAARKNNVAVSDLYKSVDSVPAKKFTTGWMSDALFIVGEDLLSRDREAALIEDITKAIDETSRQEVRESLLSLQSGAPINTTGRRSPFATIASHLKDALGNAAMQVGKCSACGHKHRLDEFGEGSSCVKCQAKLFPTSFPKWEAVTKANQKLIFPSPSAEDSGPAPSTDGLPSLSPLAIQLNKAPGFLLSTVPCTRCGTFNCEERDRCRRCGHQNRWVCNAAIEDEESGEEGVCNTVNAPERGYCSECGTARPAGSGEVKERLEVSRPNSRK